MGDNNNNELQDLCRQLKEELIEWLSLDDVSPDSLGDDDPLFGDGLGLDSLDAVEIVVLLQRKYNIQPTDMERKKEVFTSVKTLAEFILANRK